MKKNKQVYLILIAIALLIAIIGIINRNSQTETTENILDYYQNGEKVAEIKLDKVKMSEFKALLKKKVGDPIEHSFYGAPLNDILKSMDIELKEDGILEVVAEDNYKVQLSYDEIQEEGNVYLVTKMDSEDLLNLDETQVAPMIIVLNDEFSTRWVRTVKQFEEK